MWKHILTAVRARYYVQQESPDVPHLGRVPRVKNLELGLFVYVFTLIMEKA